MYGCRGRVEHLLGRTRLDHPARRTSRHPVAHPGDDAEVVGDQHRSPSRLARDLARSARGSVPARSRRGPSSARRRCSSDGDVERPRRDQRPLAHAARELVRVVDLARCSARGMPTLSSIETASRPAVGREAPRCSRTGSATCQPTRKTGFSGGHRVLEDHRDPVAPDPLHLAAPTPRSARRPVEQDRSPDTIRPGDCSRRTMQSAVIDLPQPDSPTTPSISPRST